MPGLRVPRVITVLDQPYEVTVIPADEAMARNEPPGAMGMHLGTEGKIKVRGPEDQTQAQAVDTLIHEVLHAIVYVYGLDQLFPDRDDEIIVTALTPALVHTLRNNPDVVRAIFTDYDDMASLTGTGLEVGDPQEGDEDGAHDTD